MGVGLHRFEITLAAPLHPNWRGIMIKPRPRLDYGSLMQWTLHAPLLIRVGGTIAIVTLNLLFTTVLALLSVRSGAWFGLLYPSVLISALLFNRIGGIMALVAALTLDWVMTNMVLNKIGVFQRPSNVAVTATVFAMTSLLISYAIGALHQMCHRLAANFQFLSQNNTELRLTNAKLSESEKFATDLLQETKHRFLNELQRLSSTVSLQIRAAHQQETKDALASVQSRLAAVGAIKARLDASTSLRSGKSMADIHAFFTGLCEDWTRMIDGLSVTLDTVAERHPLSENRATLLGLIANEWVTNALKYAFVGCSGGTISVRFAKNCDETYLMSVSDNGDGADFSQPPQGTGLGTKLVRAMTSQLRGKVTATPREGGGLVCSIVIPIEGD